MGLEVRLRGCASGIGGSAGGSRTNVGDVEAEATAPFCGYAVDACVVRIEVRVWGAMGSTGSTRRRVICTIAKRSQCPGNTATKAAVEFD